MKSRLIILPALFCFLLTLSSAQSYDRLPTSYLFASPGNNVFLKKNSFLVSPLGKYYLIMQNDGNLVLYKGSGPNDNQGVVWHTNTYTGKETESFLAMQDDGNLVLYRGTAGEYHTYVWQSETSSATGDYFLAMQDDGNLVVYAGKGPFENKAPIWSTKTSSLNNLVLTVAASPGNDAFLRKNEYMVSPQGKYFVHMQDDGNLVVYKGSGPHDNQGVVWHTNTYTGKDTESYLAMQEDGNLVVYRGSPENRQNHVWNSATMREKGNYFLMIQDDGNLVVYSGTGFNEAKMAVWSIQTGIIGE